jgi:hypothetical protein
VPPARTLTGRQVSFGTFSSAHLFLLVGLVSQLPRFIPQWADPAVGRNSAELADAVRDEPLEVCLLALPADTGACAVARRGRGPAWYNDLVGDELRPGGAFAGLMVEALVASGGMGTIYRATDPMLRRTVALNVIAPVLAEDPRFRDRFLVEARLAASPEHPAMVPVYTAGEVVLSACSTSSLLARVLVLVIGTTARWRGESIPVSLSTDSA